MVSVLDNPLPTDKHTLPSTSIQCIANGCWCLFNTFDRLLEDITELQIAYKDYDIIKKTMPLLARNSDVMGLEVMGLLGLLLFNGNVIMQVICLSSYFIFGT